MSQTIDVPEHNGANENGAKAAPIAPVAQAPVTITVPAQVLSSTTHPAPRAQADPPPAPQPATPVAAQPAAPQPAAQAGQLQARALANNLMRAGQRVHEFVYLFAMLEYNSRGYNLNDQAVRDDTARKCYDLATRIAEPYGRLGGGMIQAPPTGPQVQPAISPAVEQAINLLRAARIFTPGDEARWAPWRQAVDQLLGPPR